MSVKRPGIYAFVVEQMRKSLPAHGERYTVPDPFTHLRIYASLFEKVERAA
jgi:hypothetical protein